MQLPRRFGGEPIHSIERNIYNDSLIPTYVPSRYTVSDVDKTLFYAESFQCQITIMHAPCVVIGADKIVKLHYQYLRLKDNTCTSTENVYITNLISHRADPYNNNYV